MKCTDFSFLSVQIDYSQPRLLRQEAVFHIMPSLGSNHMAILSFLDAIGVRQLTWFQEHVKEFADYPVLKQGVPNWVSV